MVDGQSLPWWRSNVFVLALLAIVADIGSIIAQAPEQVLRAALSGDKAAIGQLVSLVAIGLVAAFRARSTVQPLTISDKADSKTAQLPVIALLISMAITFCILPGCATFSRHETTAKLTVQYAAAKVIDAGKTPQDKQVRADKMIQVALLVQARVGDRSVVLADLQAVLDEQILALTLPLPDELLARNLAAALVDEIRWRLADKPEWLGGEQAVQVKTVLQWVVDAALTYQLPTAEKTAMLCPVVGCAGE